jgi:hypothetical protein
MLFYLAIFRRKAPRSPTARVRATSAVFGLFSLLIRHKMLCPSGDKIMPVAALCQDFAGNLSMALYKLESITYKIFASKCFKNRGKKVALL